MKVEVAESRKGTVVSGDGRGPTNASLASGAIQYSGNHVVGATQLEAIYRQYSRELIHDARRRGFGREDSEDFTQEFFLRIAAKDSLKSFDSAKGTLRSFLLTLFQRFLTNQWHSLHTLSRGGASVTVSLDEPTSEAQGLSDWRTPERLADLHTAWVLLDHALNKMRRDLARKGKTRVFDALLPRLLHTADQASSAKAARRAGLSPVATRMAISRYRKRLRALVSDEMNANGLRNGQAGEIQCLLEMFGG